MEKKHSNIPGLKQIPTLGEKEDNLDSLSTTFAYTVKQEFSIHNQKKLLEYFNSIKNDCKCIVEIGVNRNFYELTSTSIFLENKNNDTVYIGVDLDDKSFLNNTERNIFTVRTNSINRNEIYGLMNSLNIKEIDFLFIDGWHSINMVINDWLYTEKLSKNGIVGFHDTNRHPGPFYVFEAIDENLYYKYKYFEELEDWGISFAIKK